MDAHGRALYRFNADEAPSTYITNYIVAVVALAGVVAHFVLRPKPAKSPPASASKWGSMTPNLFLLLHLTFYGVTYIIAGLGHHIWFHDTCPGLQMPENVTVPCPDGENNDPVIRAYLVTLGLGAWQLLPLIVAISGLAGACDGKCYRLVVMLSQFLALASGAYAGTQKAFFATGAQLAALYVLLAVGAACGLCVECGKLVASKVMLVLASIAVLIGFAIQVVLTPLCDSNAYREDGAASCPFPGDGVTGVNHNAVYHIFEIISKVLLVLASRYMYVTGSVVMPPTV